MAVNKGDIVLVKFPFTDLSQTKLRPAVVLYINSNLDEITLCFISSQGLTDLTPEETLLDVSDLEFTTTGLKKSSKIRTTRITTLEKRFVQRKLGYLESKYINEINSILHRTLQL
ncbi:type II toxin-antitoxin system PemK/MazF family toxin [Spirulina sp. 06S082]|uniref:type II toxin-antitoxin system PemK/MazF family toxin n=1 Tax=Spirulina sp. 06S082 TaxID=3110248 RepID=UPI002B1FBB32|nr:type II toxin-antitoxin system PemK/MazF family toxin [Spirulina sp. 06S082]MEA5471262.1 type II toxin-antitoxin system PemK/MazF family toxin [Spirulina sp. 06S082]